MSETAVPPTLAQDVRAYRSGMTLPAHMYLNARYFDYEMLHVLSDNWWLARHSSELPRSGDYVVVGIGTASIILIRGRDGVMRGFYNTCRHRGANLCVEPQGNIARITCPYHAWTYALDGKVLSAPYMSSDFDRSRHSLHAVHVREDRGLIFVNLSQTTPRDFDEFMQPHRTYLDSYDFANLKVAERRSYAVKANWKLAIENLVECYHCASGHASLCAVEGRNELLAYGMDPKSPHARELMRRIQPRLDFLAQTAGHPTVPSDTIAGVDARTGLFAANRYPLAEGFLTGTMDGAPILPFLGQAAASKGTGVRMMISTTTFVQIYADHAVCLSYLPQSADCTVIEQSWLVNAEAEIDVAVTARLTALWDQTTREDGWLAENQVRGIEQPVYEPGWFSAMESGPRGFLDWYIQQLRRSLEVQPVPAAPH